MKKKLLSQMLNFPEKLHFSEEKRASNNNCLRLSVPCFWYILCLEGESKNYSRNLHTSQQSCQISAYSWTWIQMKFMFLAILAAFRKYVAD